MNAQSADQLLASAFSPGNLKTIVRIASLAILLMFDTVLASESRSDASSMPAQQPPMDKAPMDGDTPATAPPPKPRAPPEDATNAPMKGMDMPAAPVPEPSSAPPMQGMDMAKPAAAGSAMGSMGTGAMQGGKAPPDARDPDAYADGYKYSAMPGLERYDHLKVAKVLVDELEFLTGNEGKGVNWTAQGTYGGDQDKLWVRTQGQKIPGTIVDASTGFEALWWHATSAFWGSQLGVRRDIGPGSYTYLAFGTEGLAPRWFEVQATGYIGEQGRLAGRLKASYDMRFTNRLILTPSVETNVYSKPDAPRGAGAGLSTIESALRLRYEVQRKFAPYLGFVWERSFAGTAVLRRAEGSPVNERSIVAGLRLWF